MGRVLSELEEDEGAPPNLDEDPVLFVDVAAELFPNLDADVLVGALPLVVVLGEGVGVGAGVGFGVEVGVGEDPLAVLLVEALGFL